MKTFEVTIIRTAYVTYTVGADSPEQAEERVWGQYDPLDADDCCSNEIYSIEEITDE